MNENLRILDLSGIVAAIWMLVGVIIVARMFPGYSHTHQALSELGAKGRPTAKIHPFINNYPIGLLFSLFGIALYLNHRDNIFSLISAGLIFIHGICHVITGLFPCDENLGQSKPSRTQIVHSVAGLVMLLTLFSASVLWVFATAAGLVWFRGLSAVCAVVSIYFLTRVFKGMNIGLYQRISYGALVFWAAVLSGVCYWYL